MPTNFDPREYLHAFEEAAASGDMGGLERYWSEDVEFKDPTLQEARRGKDAFREDQRKWLDAMSDVRFDIDKIVRSGNDYAVYMRAHGRNTGDLELAPGARLPATNKEVDLDYANFISVDDSGKVTRDVAVFDVASMMQQLGVSPEEMQAATRGGR